MPKDFLKGRDALGKRITKPVLMSLVQDWHDEMLERHFEPGAQQRYGYQRRTIGYLRRKQNYQARRGLGDANRPLQFTGQLRRRVTRQITISGSNKRVVGRMPAPWYVTANHAGNYPDLEKELTRVNHAEERELGRRAEKRLMDLYYGLSDSRRITV